MNFLRQSIPLLLALLTVPCSAPSSAEPLDLSLASTLPSNLVFWPGTTAFPAETRPWLQAAARSALAVVRNRIGAEPPCGYRPIVCIFDKDVPLTAEPGFDRSTYWIRLNVSGLHYCQLVYQLSHELGHVMFDPRRSNGLIESLCDALSYQSLDDCDALWAHDPPFSNWKDYHQEFHRYRTDDEAAALAAFPLEIQEAVKEGRWNDIALYLRYRRPDLDRDPFSEEGHTLRRLAAIAFTSDTVPWESLAGIAGHTNPSPAIRSDFSQTLPTDLLQVPPVVLPSLRRIGRARTDDFVAASVQKHPPAALRGFLRSLTFRDGDHWVFLGEYLNPHGSNEKKVRKAILKLHPAEPPRWEGGFMAS